METIDRRRAYRTNVTDTWAQCSSHNSVGSYLVEDLSHKGILLKGEPALPVETPIRIRLLLPEQEPVILDGTVSRLSTERSRKPRLAVEFAVLTDDEEETLDDFIVRKVVRDLSPVVLIGNSCEWESKSVARTLQSMGFMAMRASTPLGIIRQIGPHNPSIGTVILGTHLRGTNPMEVAAFLSEFYPEIRLIYMGKRPSWRTRQEAKNVVHTVLRKPWTDDSLKQALSAAI